MIGVQGDIDRVGLCDMMGELGERLGAEDHVLHPGAGEEIGATGGNLYDAVTAGIGEALQRGVQGLGRSNVDRRVGERLGLGPVKHLRVDVRGGDGHGSGSCEQSGLRVCPVGNELICSAIMGGKPHDEYDERVIGAGWDP